MSWRTVIIANQAKLDYKMGYMVVRGLETKRIHIEEIAVLVIENPAVSLTGCLLEALIARKVKVIFCDSKRSPVAELVPHHGSHDSSAKIRTQSKWSPEVKALIWQEIISEKIRKQAEFLRELHCGREADLLESYIGQVELLDASNREGHAAKVYFNALFGNSFTRSADTPVNAALNYGYSLLLSSFSPEVAANGYLTQLGIFHDNTMQHCIFCNKYKRIYMRLHLTFRVIFAILNSVSVHASSRSASRYDKTETAFPNSFWTIWSSWESLNAESCL